MRAVSFLVATLAASVSVVSADRIAIQVGANKTANASMIFQPQEVHAKQGDVVVFNFTNGTYDVIQADFAAPCIPINQFNSSENGFNSGVRPAINGTAITTLEVNINDNFTAIWFYENSTCGQGGVGVINANDSSTTTLAGFSRNAQRFNGTQTSSSASPSQTGTNSGSGSSPSASPSGSDNTTSDAQRRTVFGATVALPLAALALLL